MSTSIADVNVDVCLSVEHSYENEVTSHPVESGADVTDNVVAKSLVINLDCIISATPLGLAPNTIFGPNIVTGTRDRLIAIDVAKQPITVVDSYGTFTNMVLEKIIFSKTTKTGDALAFKASFKELIIITNDRTVIQVAIPRAQAVVARGAKSSKSPPTPPVPAKAADRRSGLRRVINHVAPSAVSTTPNQGGS